MAIAMVTVFLTSCEKENLLTDTASPENLLTEKEAPEFFLPFGYDELSDEEINEYTKSLDDEAITRLVESTKIYAYFKYLGKYDILISNAKFGDIFDQSTLVLYLSDSEVKDFATTDFMEIVELRWGCSDWYTIIQCTNICTRQGRWGCEKWEKKRKEKKVCDYWPDKHRWVRC